MLLLLRVLLQLIYVPTASMETTIPTRSLVVGWRLPYAVADPVPQRGAIVTFWNDEEGEVLVKRVVGLPGETVSFEGGDVYIDGAQLGEDYLPEGVDFHPQPFSLEALREAMLTGRILQATAVLCDEKHDLYVDLGCCTGRIPREEAALGIPEGQTRDIAILVRVGKPVCFRVVSVSPEGEVLLSRRAAQLQALSYLLQLEPGTILPAVVTSCTAFGAFCDAGCGVPALIGLESLCISRLRHASELLTENETIYAAVSAVDPLRQRISLSLKELLGTWSENAAGFRQGQTVTGIVRSVQDYGVFIELTPNLSGLADPVPDVQPGDAVSIYIKSIHPERCKLKLTVLRRLDTAPAPKPLHYFRTAGSTAGWCYKAPSAIHPFLS